MKILLIEDEVESVDRVRRLLDDISSGHELVIGASRDDAFQLLDDDYDLLICDLRIPPQSGSMDIAEEYGFQVHAAAQSRIPGIPSVFFTGFATKANIRDSLSRGETADLFGTGVNVPTAKQLDKDQQIDLAKYLRMFISELNFLESIPLDADGIPDLGRYEARALQMYARRLSGVRVVVRPLGGLSGARSLRASVLDSDSNTRASVFCKIQPRERAIDEKRRFEDNVPNLLGLGGPSSATEIFFGIGRLGALFFSLAGAHLGDLFDTAANDESAAVEGVSQIRQLLTPWRNVRAQREVTVEILRRRKTPDSLLDQWRATGELLSEAEERQVLEIPFAIQHGDFHGRNALLLEDSRWLVIDFAEVESAPRLYGCCRA
jgi:CheY-like chemotaxis protein